MRLSVLALSFTLWLLGLTLLLATATKAGPTQVHNQSLSSPSLWDPACYRTYEQARAFLQNIADTYPDIVSIASIGYAWENTRQLWLMQIGSTRNNGGNGGHGLTPVLYVIGGQHPRDIATAAVVMSYTLHLARNYNLDPDVTWLVDHRTILLLPLANPDGYHQVYYNGYSYWYKNTDSDDGCTDQRYWGTDINRNYPFHWNEGGAGSNPCDSSYPGPSALSEPESRHILASINAMQPALVLNLQAPGPSILYPWGWTAQPPPNAAGLHALGWQFARLNATPPQSVRTHNAEALISGILDDTVYGVYGAPAFTFNIGTVTSPGCVALDQIWRGQLPALMYAAKVAGPSPAVTLSRSFGPAVLDLTATTETSTTIRLTGVLSANYGTIANAVYRIDSPGADGSGTPMSGNYGGRTANVSALIDTGNLPPGRHIALVQGSNDAQQWGVYSSIFFTVTGGTSTATPAPTASSLPTATPTATPSATPPSTPSHTPTFTATATTIATATGTPVLVPTTTTTTTPTPTPTNTPLRSTVTATATATATATHTVTSTPGVPVTATPTHTARPTSPTPTPTRTPTFTPTPRPPDTPTPLPCSSYSDVRPGQYFYEAVEWLTCRRIVSGYADGTFRPYNPSTRAQLVKMIVLGHAWPLLNPPTPTFTDVLPFQWHYRYIETAAARHVIGGYADGTFRPDNHVTRGQLCKIIVLASGWQLVRPARPTFSDVPPGSTFYEYVETAFAHSIISGYADGTFRPDNNATRGQLSKMLHAALNRSP
jgi:hypothetical protein